MVSPLLVHVICTGKCSDGMKAYCAVIRVKPQKNALVQIEISVWGPFTYKYFLCLLKKREIAQSGLDSFLFPHPFLIL